MGGAAVAAISRQQVRLTGALLSNDGSVVGYILRAWMVALVPAIPLALIVSWANPAGLPPIDDVPYGFLVIYGIFGAPVIETALMAGWLVLARRFVGPIPAVVSSAVLWAVLHALTSVDQGLTVWWPFLVFSTAFLVWRRDGIDRGMEVAAAIHLLYNASLFGAGALLP